MVSPFPFGFGPAKVDLLNRETPTEHLVHEGLTQSYRNYAAHFDVLLILGKKIIAVAEALGFEVGALVSALEGVKHRSDKQDAQPPKL